jgi:predicted ATPase
MLQAHHCCWASHYHAGDFGRSAGHLRAGLDIYHGGDFRHHARLYGNHDAKSCAHGEFARLLWMQGQLRQSAEHERLSLEWARGLNHVGSLVHALDSAMFVRVYRRDFAAVRALADELIAFTSEHGIADHAASGHILCGWVAAINGDAAAGLRRLDEGLARHRAVATYEDFPVYACVLAEALIRNGDPEQAAAVLARERAEFERIGIEVWRSEVIRMQAESALALGKAEQACALLAEAEEVVLRQGTPMLRLRSAVTFAALPDSVRDPAVAHSRLRRAVDAVPEPDGSDDFERAYLALDQLGTDSKRGVSAA